MNYCSIENKLCSIAKKDGLCPVSACVKKNETIHAVYKEGKKVWPPEDKEGGTDYHAKQDCGKAKLTLVPRRILWDVATIREYGNNKYPEGGPDNWKTVEVDRYRDAAYRHFMLYLDDPHGVDEESGLPHLWHLACNIAFLCEMEDEFLSERIPVAKKIEDPYSTTEPQIVWTNYIPEACRSCSNHPSNGGTGICHCTLWSPSVTSGVVWREEDLNIQPSSFTTTASIDCQGK